MRHRDAPGHLGRYPAHSSRIHSRETDRAGTRRTGTAHPNGGTCTARWRRGTKSREPESVGTEQRSSIRIRPHYSAKPIEYRAAGARDRIGRLSSEGAAFVDGSLLLGSARYLA